MGLLPAFLYHKSKSMAAVIQPVLRLPYNVYGGRHTRVLQPSYTRRSFCFSSSIEKNVWPKGQYSEKLLPLSANEYHFQANEYKYLSYSIF